MSKIFSSATTPAGVRRILTDLRTCMSFGVLSPWTAGFSPLNFPPLLLCLKQVGFYRANYLMKEKFS